MKKMKLKIIITSIALLTISGFAYSQWGEAQINVSLGLPQIALVDIEPAINNSIHFSVVPSGESGNSAIIQKSSSQNLWINYSSCLSTLHNSRSILAEVSQGKLPDGMIFYIEASGYSGFGKGQLGQTAGKINITSRPKSIITNLGNCFTGDGINNGHLLNFSLEINDYSTVNAIGETNFTIRYTITDN